MNSINTLLPQYREINIITTNVIKNSWVNDEEQKVITEFYHKYSDLKVFEQMILDIIQKQDIKAYSLLLSGIRNIIENNIDLYESTSDLLNKIDTNDIYKEKIKLLQNPIDRQLRIKTESYKELYEVNKSLDAIGHRDHSLQEKEILWIKHEQLTKEYNEEKEKLSVLYDQQKEMQNEFSKYNKNLFSKIHTLSISFLSVINSYNLVEEKEKEKEEQKPEEREKSQILEDGSYIDMMTVGLVHKKCNKKQFEYLSENALYAILNLQPINTVPVIKYRQKNNMCQLIGLLYEFLKLDHQEKLEWKKSILDIFKIKESYYKSKYNKRKDSLVTKEFSLCLDEIF
ncbi:hypothetical protein HZQ23_08210 [Elizabethkingia anophelis]|nr:hypothetical protein [Elizabethkingia anophelis]MCT4008885.1 hypothetical protein [Elizabethkingia anophelis]